MAWIMPIVILFVWINLLSGTLEHPEDTITIYNTAPEFKFEANAGKVISNLSPRSYPQGANANPLFNSDGEGSNTLVYQRNTGDTMGYVPGNREDLIKKKRRQKRDSTDEGSQMTNEQCSVS